MRVQDYIAGECKAAAEEVFRYAKAVPADKLNWSPDGAGRSVINICQELAMTPTWGHTVITKGWQNPTDEDRETGRREMESWSSVEQCQDQFNIRFAELEILYRGFTDEQLKETKWLPFNGGREHTILEMMDYPRWNCTYHLGQIAYIQILYGDKEMH